MTDTQPDPPTDTDTSKAGSFDEHKRLRQAELRPKSPITVDEFQEKHKSGLDALWHALDQQPELDAVPPPVSQVIYELRRCRLVQLMRYAAKEKCSEMYIELLSLLLEQVDASPPGDVLVPHGKPGRPRHAPQIYISWVAMGKPSLNDNGRTLTKLVKQFYPEEFAKAKTDRDRKRLRDRVRSTILRQNQR